MLAHHVVDERSRRYFARPAADPRTHGEVVACVAAEEHPCPPVSEIGKRRAHVYDDEPSAGYVVQASSTAASSSSQPRSSSIRSVTVIVTPSFGKATSPFAGTRA